MSLANSQPPIPKLSFCIPTLNRAAYIGETLDSLLSQLTDECEIVILDGGSTDDTQRVVADYMRRCAQIRYVRQDVAHGFDRDCNRVVELARGKYCWLKMDDDPLKPGAVAAVLAAIRDDVSLVLVNTEGRDVTLRKVLEPRWLDFESDRVYASGEMDRLFLEVGQVLMYVGCFVVHREMWMAREKEKHCGSLFNYLAVVFQEQLPGKTVVISAPLIIYRWGNTHTWTGQVFHAISVTFPALVASFPISDSAKRKLCATPPWKSMEELWFFRGLGYYTISEYRQCIRPQLPSMFAGLTPMLLALLPATLANALFILYYSTTRRLYRGKWDPEVVLQDMRKSPFNVRNWRLFKRAAA
jgi:abequosyltransferase